LGILWLLKHGPKLPQAFISICGFDCFFRHVSKREIKAMSRKLDHDMWALMQNFWKASDTGDFCEEEALNRETLKTGLDWLMTWDATEALRNLHCPVLALAATSDAIVPSAMTEAIWQGYDLRWCDTGSHVLPLSHTDWCAEHIKSFLHDL
jgi:pimeloyl-[acyl-carrier protein] methyl ester esterase